MPNYNRVWQALNVSRWLSTTLTILVLAAALAAPSRGASAETFMVEGDQIQFDPGPPYCFLDEGKDEFDRVMLQTFRSLNQGRNIVVALFLECEVLAASRKGVETSVGQYGGLMAPLANQSSPPKYPDYTRTTFLDQMSNVFAKGGKLDPATLQSRIDEVWNSMGLGHIKLGESRQLGPLLLDEAALYMGFVATYEFDGKPTTTGIVSAITLVKDHVLSITLNRELANVGTIKKLLGEQRVLVRKFISQNEPTKQPLDTLRR